jgi:hypothetical protein
MGPPNTATTFARKNKALLYVTYLLILAGVFFGERRIRSPVCGQTGALPEERMPWNKRGQLHNIHTSACSVRLF